MSAGLPEDIRIRLRRLAGRRWTGEGVIVITARRHRTQERNREDARQRLFELIALAAQPPVRRAATKPSKASRRRRLDAKRRRAQTKQLRQGPAETT